MTSPSDAYRTAVVRLAHVRGAYGGTGVSAPGYCAIRPYFEVTAARAISGLRVADLEVFEGATLIARASAPIALRISLPGRDRDHNPITAPFDGSIAAGTTLRLVATTELTELPADFWRKSHGYRATIVVTSSGGDETLLLEGALDDPWATAGPALIR